MHFDERFGVLGARQAVVRGEFQHRGQQQLGIIEYLAGDADARQQAHRLDVVAVLQQECPDRRLRAIQVSVHEQGRRGNHLARQAAQGRHVARGDARVRLVTGHAVQALEHAPAHGQRIVAVHGREEGLDRRLRLAHRDVALAAFLVERG